MFLIVVLFDNLWMASLVNMQQWCCLLYGAQSHNKRIHGSTFCVICRILVNMGCSPVGCILIQLARLWGAHVTAVTSLRGIPVIQALGAHDVVVCDEEVDVQNQLASREGYGKYWF
jgi:NADPH:quinone reductase-like Zn-dependent oxidoreductase